MTSDAGFALAYFGHRVVAKIDRLGEWLAIETTPRLAPETEVKRVQKETGEQDARRGISKAALTTATPAAS